MTLPPAFIRSATAISPQYTFGEAESNFLNPALSTQNGQLYNQEGEYRKYINPVAIRRMSRALKAAIAAGMEALYSAGIQTPDAIVTGTGNGSVEDMETFLLEMISLEEDTLQPTAFIQSTYNAPNGWLAINSKCTGYNQAYVQRGSSLELALQDAQMLLAEGEARYVLAGSYDNLTEKYVQVKDNAQYWRRPWPENSLDLLNLAPAPGTIGGEGSAFFVLSTEAEGALARFIGTAVCIGMAGGHCTATIHKFLAEHDLKPESIGRVITGWNGDSRLKDFYDSAHAVFPNAELVGYKHLCGEYDTASGFALWLAVRLLQKGEYNPLVVLRKNNGLGGKVTLLLNHSVQGDATMMLVEGV